MTIAHLIAIIMVHGTQKYNVYSSLGAGSGNYPTSDLEKEAFSEIRAILAFSYFCFTLSFLGLFFGFTLFFVRINVFNILVHFIGGLWVSWFIAFEWKYETLFWIITLTNATTAIVEAGMIFAIFVLKVVVY